MRVLPWAGFRAAATYTFDDSQPSQIEHWPELQAAGAPMTFFINPSEKWSPRDDAAWAAVAAGGSEIANHTRSHCRSDAVACLPEGRADDDIDQANAYITSRLAVNAVYSFAAPFGDAGWNRFSAPRFLVGRGILSGIVPSSGVSDWYDLPCFPVEAGQTGTAFKNGLDRARAQRGWIIFLFHSILPTTSNWFAGVEVAGITASIAYGQSLGDIWIDTMAAVGAYARAKQMFDELTPREGAWMWKLPAHFPPGRILRVVVDGGTLSQGGTPLPWDSHGYYEVKLDEGVLTWKP